MTILPGCLTGQQDPPWSFQGSGIYSKGEPSKTGIDLELDPTPRNRSPASTGKGEESREAPRIHLDNPPLVPTLTLTDAGILSGFMPRGFHTASSL